MALDELDGVSLKVFDLFGHGLGQAGPFCTAAKAVISDELLDLVLHDRLAEAVRVAHELTSTLSEIPYRRSPYLSVERKNELLNVRTQLQTIEQEIVPETGQPLAPKKKQNLIKVCRQSSQTVRENLGIIKGQVEFGGTHARPDAGTTG